MYNVQKLAQLYVAGIIVFIADAHVQQPFPEEFL